MPCTVVGHPHPAIDTALARDPCLDEHARKAAERECSVPFKPSSHTRYSSSASPGYTAKVAMQTNMDE
jgi:hypothetical protein